MSKVNFPWEKDFKFHVPFQIETRSFSLVVTLTGAVNISQRNLVT